MIDLIFAPPQRCSPVQSASFFSWFLEGGSEFRLWLADVAQRSIVATGSHLKVELRALNDALIPYGPPFLLFFFCDYRFFISLKC
jgi:hypothetical protein